MGSLMEYRRRILLNTPHLESASGSVAHFKTDMASKLKECKVNFLPQQAGSGDPSPSNVRAISGWTGINLYQIGDTGYPIEPIVGSTLHVGVTWTVDENGKVTVEGTPTGASNIRLGFVNVNGDETLYIMYFGSANNINSNKPVLYDASNNVITTSLSDNVLSNGVDLSQFDGVKRIRVNVKRARDNVYMHGNFVAIISAGSPAVPNQITVSWQDLGMIYGGFIDVLRGELVQEWGIIASYNGETLPSEWISDRDVYSPHATPTTGAQVAYKLATPITYSITQAIIKTLKGINNIFSDAGDVSVKYWTH